MLDFYLYTSASWQYLASPFSHETFNCLLYVLEVRKINSNQCRKSQTDRRIWTDEYKQKEREEREKRFYTAIRHDF